MEGIGRQYIVHNVSLRECTSNNNNFVLIMYDNTVSTLIIGFFILLNYFYNKSSLVYTLNCFKWHITFTIRQRILRIMSFSHLEFIKQKQEHYIWKIYIIEKSSHSKRQKITINLILDSKIDYYSAYMQGKNYLGDSILMQYIEVGRKTSKYYHQLSWNSIT